MSFCIISIFICIFAFACHAAPKQNTEKNGLPSDHPLIYWSKVVKTDQELRELALFLRDEADKVNHIEYIKKDNYDKKGPDYKPIAPMMLFPSKFPRRIFDLAEAGQPAMNLLYFRASLDYKFLKEAFEETAKGDEYIRNLMKVLTEMQSVGYKQPIAFQLQRADYYMCYGKDAPNDDVDKYTLKQIEVNIGGAGGPPNSVRQTKVHRQLLKKIGMDSSMELLRDNRPYTTYLEPLVLAWHKFGDPDALMIIVIGTVPAGTGGKKTQYDLENELKTLSSGRLKYVRLTYTQCDRQLTLAEDNSLLLRIKDQHGTERMRKVSVVFFRFPIRNDEAEWRARALIERSTAIKGPTIGMELIGTKKGQQALAKPGAVERFFPEPAEAHLAKAVRDTFAGLWGMENEDDEETQEIIKEAMAHPERFVMKPMKEGGGNNFFGQDVANKLHEFTPTERAAHILMERLQPVAVPNYFVRSAEEQPKFGMVVPELSTFGGLVGNILDGTVLHNHGHGYLARTKPEESNEGGIFSGLGAYDTPYLY